MRRVGVARLSNCRRAQPCAKRCTRRKLGAACHSPPPCCPRQAQLTAVLTPCPLLQVPMTIVVGSPIEVPKLDSPSDEDAEKYLQQVGARAAPAALAAAFVERLLRCALEAEAGAACGNFPLVLPCLSHSSLILSFDVSPAGRSYVVPCLAQPLPPIPQPHSHPAALCVQYIEAIQGMWDRHKEAAGYASTELVIY